MTIKTKKYILLGKLAPNNWVPVNLMSDKFSQVKWSFESLIEAGKVKSQIKNYYRNYAPEHKFPLKIVVREE